MMHKQVTIYMAVDPQDQPIADIIVAYLKGSNYRFINAEDVQQMLTPAEDLYSTMNESDLLVLVDSEAFRARKENLELSFAQKLNKPLIVISLHQAVDESKSTYFIRLFDFTHPQHRQWLRVIHTIHDMIHFLTAEPEFSMFF